MEDNKPLASATGGNKNQAAQFETRTEEARTKCMNFNTPVTSRVGHVLIKFKALDGESFLVKSASGIIVKQLSSKKYLMMTCAHIFDSFIGQEKLQIDEGAFFLQRNGLNEYAGRFRFTAKYVKT